MIKVSIYEDNEGLRETLSSIINEQEDFECIGAYGDCLDAIKNTKGQFPDVVIMDIDLPGLSGIEGTRIIKMNFPETEIIVHTVFDDDNRVFDAILAGATGYILKKSPLATLLSAIKEVKTGGAPMSPSIARKVLQIKSEKNKDQKEVFTLTDKEYQVLQALSKGLSYKMVANDMKLSIDTIRAHIKKIYEKLHVHSITEAVYKVFIEKE